MKRAAGLQAQELVKNLLPYSLIHNPICFHSNSIVQTTNEAKIEKLTLIILFLIQFVEFCCINVAHYVATAFAFWSSY